MARQARLRFRAATEFAVDAFERVRRPQGFPLRWRKAQEGVELIAGFVEALSDCGTAEPPLAQKARARLLDQRAAVGVDHAPIIFGQLFAQPDRRFRFEVPQLVGGTPLDGQRRPLLLQRGRQAGAAVNDRERRPADVPLDQTANDIAPRRSNFRPPSSGRRE